jgi:hypothetical protein
MQRRWEVARKFMNKGKRNVLEKENGANSCHFAKATCLLGRTKSVSCVLSEIEEGLFMV